MKKLYAEITKSLDVKKAELEQRREHFSIFCHNEIKSSCFERNAINDLLVMQQLKSEIEELDHWELLIRSQICKEGE